MNAIFIALALSLTSYADNRVRRVEVKDDKIVTVQTALGIATIIQVPDRPNSVVVGDQEGFRVEYLDQAVTIKPLHGGAKSNLYIYTDYRRYNVQLVTGPIASAEYVVYLENSKSKASSPDGVAWMSYSNHLRNDPVTLNIKRLGRATNGLLFVDGVISTNRNLPVDPKWFWITQNGSTRPIHRLFLSQLSVRRGETAQVMIQLLRSDLVDGEPFLVEVRRMKASYLTIPKVNSWK